MMTILDEIVAHKRIEVEAARERFPERCLRDALPNLPPVRPFIAALRDRIGIGIIAEVKKASPSAGVIRADFDPVAIAEAYANNGADCISVLTDEQFFQGHLGYLGAIRKRVSCPLLRKDFVIDRYQLLESRMAGADAVLLIAECLPGDQLKRLYDESRLLGLDVLVELHDAEELARVLDSGAELIGINNRDLRTFQTSLEHTFQLMEKIPAGRWVVSESGIRTHEDLQRLEKAGVKAVLVGETLMRAVDIGKALVALHRRAEIE